MLELIFNNENIKISGTYDKNVISLINEVCSYQVPTAEWSDKYQSGHWDGKISLLNKRLGTFPSGILNLVIEILEENKIKYSIKDERKIPVAQKNARIDLSEYKFRDYQQKIIDCFKEKQRGIIAVGTGGGKTFASCGIISEISVYPVVFIVPGVTLLKQTVNEFNQFLKPEIDEFGIGEIGGGSCSIYNQGVNVCTYQTILTAFDKKYSETTKKIVDLQEDKTSMSSLEKQFKILTVDLENSPSSKLKNIQKKIKDVENKIKNKKELLDNKSKIRELISNYQLLFIDEAHIAVSIVEFIASKSINAFYRCSLSATPQRTDNQDLRMFGATGPVIYKISASDLIQKEYLVKPFIYTIDLDFIDKTSISYQETYKNAIVLSDQRNNLIKSLAEEMHSQGRPTLILVERIEHGKILQELIHNCIFVPGGNNDDDRPIEDKELNYRKYQLNRLENNEIIMIGTQWASTGLNAPKVSCLILAGSTASPITTIQQIGRVLRKAPDKNNCVVFDFKHKEKSLRSHFNSRLRAFKTESEFCINSLKINKDGVFKLSKIQ